MEEDGTNVESLIPPSNLNSEDASEREEEVEKVKEDDVGKEEKDGGGLINNFISFISHHESASAAAAAAAAGNSSSFGGKLCKSDSTAECSSSTVHECDGRVEVEHGDMDWTFLKEFDYSNDVFPVVGSDYDLYFDLHNMHSTSGELLYSTPPPPPFEGYQEFTEAEEDPFSHQSFLWNWNF